MDKFCNFCVTQGHSTEECPSRRNFSSPKPEVKTVLSNVKERVSNAQRQAKWRKAHKEQHRVTHGNVMLTAKQTSQVHTFTTYGRNFFLFCQEVLGFKDLIPPHRE